MQEEAAVAMLFHCPHPPLGWNFLCVLFLRQ
jgi:hypothetical protein